MEHLEEVIQHHYAECRHIRRPTPDYYAMNEAELKKITLMKMRVLPIYEQNLFEYKLLRNSSLTENELLKCRWAGFVNRLEGRVRTPFIFPSVDDLHFCRHLVRYEPTETIKNRTNYRFHLTCGPGVDLYGQKPIPDNMHLRKTIEAKHGEEIKYGKKLKHD